MGDVLSRLFANINNARKEHVRFICTVITFNVQSGRCDRVYRRLEFNFYVTSIAQKAILKPMYTIFDFFFVWKYQYFEKLHKTNIFRDGPENLPIELCT